MEYRTFMNAPVCSEERGEEAAPQLSCRFATFTGEYDMGYGCYERIDPHAFDDTINDDIRILFNHDSGVVLGRTRANTAELRIGPDGLDGDVKINEKDSEAMDVYERVKRGDITGCSFGFDIIDESVENRADGTALFTLRKVKLYECSVCTFPAYTATSASARSGDNAAHIKAFKYRMKERLKHVESH